MVDYTDFKSGLQNVNQYLDGKHHLTGRIAVGDDALRLVASAEYSFTMRELLCGILSGNGIKLPNLQVGLNCALESLLQSFAANMQQEVIDAISQVQVSLNDFMDHTKMENILGRLTAVVSEAQQIASLLNFCAQPVDPVAIPNMIEKSFGSFLGPGQKIMNDIGKTTPGASCTLCGNPFNPQAFVGGFLGAIANKFDEIIAGALPLNEVASLVSQAEALSAAVSGLISSENNISGSYSHGGSNFGTVDTGCKNPDRVGVMHNARSGNIADNANLTNALKSLYDNLAGYPVDYTDPDSGEKTEHANIFELLLDDELIEILKREDDVLPTISEQVPIYDYCGNIKGYREVFDQQSQQSSDGTLPLSLDNNPGQLAGGFDTFTTSTGGSTGGTSNTTVVYNTGGDGGGNVYIVGSEASQLALQLNTHDIVVRSDILLSYVRKDTNSFKTGTLTDFQPMSVRIGQFVQSLSDLSTSGVLIKDGNVARTRSILGTPEQIVVTNTTGIGGDIVIRLENNTTIPGVGSVKIPSGTTLERDTGENGAIRYNTDINGLEAYHENLAAWIKVGADTTTNAVELANIGQGAEVYKQLNVTSGKTELRSISAANGITVTENANEITIGDTITASNIGGEAEIFSSRTGNDFQFKTLVGAGNISVNTVGNTVEITDTGNLKVATATTTDASSVQVLFNGATYEPETDESWFYTLKAIALDTTTKQTRAFKIEGVVQNDSDTVALVGTPSKIDYQRSTGDVGVDPWNASSTYNAGDQVEYDLIIYEVGPGLTVQPWENNPPNNPNWTVVYNGWNVSTTIVNDQFQVRVRGDANATINWKVNLEIVSVS